MALGNPSYRITDGNKTSQTSTTTGLNLSASVGYMHLVGIACDNAGTNGTSPLSGVTDSQGNIYTLIGETTNTAGTALDGVTTALYAGYISTALVNGVDTITISYTTNVTAKAIVSAVLIDGASPSSLPYIVLNPYGTDTNNGSSATYTSNTSPTMGANDLYIAIIGNESNTAASIDTDTTNGTWNSVIFASSNGGGADATKVSVLMMTKPVTGSGTQTANGNNGATNAWGIVSAYWKSGYTRIYNAQAQARIKAIGIKNFGQSLAQITPKLTTNTLYLSTNAADINIPNVTEFEGWFNRGTGVTTLTGNSASVVGSGQALSSGGFVALWITPPLESVTLTSITLNLRVSESNASANNTLFFRLVEILDDPSTLNIVGTITEYGDPVEMGTGETLYTPTISSLNYTVSSGNRLAIRWGGWDYTNGNAGYTITGYYGSTTAGTSGDSYVTFANTLTKWIPKRWSQAQAKIKAFNVEGFGQAQAQISGAATRQQFAQTQADIKAVSRGFAQAQSDIKATSLGYAQAQSWLKVTDVEGFGQAQSWIKVTAIEGFAQAQTDINAIGRGFSQAQADIQATSTAYAQAQARIKQTYSVAAQANAWIKATHPYSFEHILYKDSFTDTDGTLLTAHTSEATWIVSTPAAGTTPTIYNGRVYNNDTSTGRAAVTGGSDPPTYDYAVEADLYVASNTGDGGITTHDKVTNENYYRLRYLQSSGYWQLSAIYNSGANSDALGTYSQTLTVGQTYHMKLQVDQGYVSAFIDGVLRIGPVLDTTSVNFNGDGTVAYQKGRPGLRFGASQTTTTGYHLDNFVAYVPGPFGQTQAKILAIGKAFAQAQAAIRVTTYAQAQADIKQTYPFGGSYTIAQDSFTGSGALTSHTAEIGGTWSLISGTATLAGLSSGYASGQKSAGGTAGANYYQLGSGSVGDGDIYLESWDAGGGEGQIFRIAASDTFYGITVINDIDTGGEFHLWRMTGGTKVDLASDASPPGNGSGLNVRVQIVGSSPTTIRAKWWLIGDSEPGWRFDLTDNTSANQTTAGGYGALIYTDTLYYGKVDNFLAISGIGGPTGPTFAQAQAKIVKTTSVFAQAQARIKATYSGFAQAQTGIKAVGNGFAQAQAQIQSITTNTVYAQANADIKAVGQGFAQSQADIKAVGRGFAQGQADIKAIGQGFAQAQSDIKATSRGLAQSQADIKVTTNQFAQTQADVKAISRGFAQAQSDIKATSSVFAQTQAKLNSVAQQYAQALSNIKGIDIEGLGQAQGQVKAIGWPQWAQAQADTKAVSRGFAQAQADTKATSLVFAQSQADIKVTTAQFAQSQADIKATSRGFAQAQGDIKATSVVFAQAQADIKHTYTGFAQSQADVKAIGWGNGNANADIKVTTNQFAQSNADIKATSSAFAQSNADVKASSLVYASAQADVKATYQAFAQSQADIKVTTAVFAQAQAAVKGNAFGQTQADIQATYLVFAQAQARLVGIGQPSGQALAYVYIPQIARPISDVSNDGNWVGTVRN